MESQPGLRILFGYLPADFSPTLEAVFGRLAIEISKTGALEAELATVCAQITDLETTPRSVTSFDSWGSAPDHRTEVWTPVNRCQNGELPLSLVVLEALRLFSYCVATPVSSYLVSVSFETFK